MALAGFWLSRSCHQADIGPQVPDKTSAGYGRAVANHGRVIDGLTNQIEHYMDLLSTRQKLTASNMANIDTPGYKTKDIDFQFEFLSLAQGQSPDVKEVGGQVIKSDGNDVSLDREARMLSENAMRFNVVSNLMRTQLKMVESAIKEGS
jgi:flagellar basal-body rod protein FlgB